MVTREEWFDRLLAATRRRSHAMSRSRSSALSQWPQNEPQPLERAALAGLVNGPVGPLGDPDQQILDVDRIALVGLDERDDLVWGRPTDPRTSVPDFGQSVEHLPYGRLRVNVGRDHVLRIRRLDRLDQL